MDDGCLSSCPECRAGRRSAGLAARDLIDAPTDLLDGRHETVDRRLHRAKGRVERLDELMDMGGAAADLDRDGARSHAHTRRLIDRRCDRLAASLPMPPHNSIHLSLGLMFRRTCPAGTPRMSSAGAPALMPSQPSTRGTDDAAAWGRHRTGESPRLADARQDDGR